MGQKHAKQTYEINPPDSIIATNHHASYRKSEPPPASTVNQKRMSVTFALPQQGEAPGSPSGITETTHTADIAHAPNEIILDRTQTGDVEDLIKRMVNQEVVRRMSATGEEQFVSTVACKRMSASIQSRYEEVAKHDDVATTSRIERDVEQPLEHPLAADARDKDEENIAIAASETLKAFDQDIESYEAEKSPPRPPPYSEIDPIQPKETQENGEMTEESQPVSVTETIRESSEGLEGEQKNTVSKLKSTPPMRSQQPPHHHHRLQQIKNDESNYRVAIRNSQTHGNEILFEIVNMLEQEIGRLMRKAQNFKGKREGSEFLTIRTELEEVENKLRNVRSGLSTRLDRKIGEDLQIIQDILNDRD